MHRRTLTVDLSSHAMKYPSPRFCEFPLSKSPFSSRPGTLFSSSNFILSRQWLQRTTLLAIFSLLFLSAYFFMVAGPANPRLVAIPNTSPHKFRTAMNSLAHSKKLWQFKHQHSLAARPQISLTPEQELAAVSSFIISLPTQNVLPLSIDPSQTIDPQLVLDFDTRADGASAELTKLVADVWDTNPVVLYSKPSAASRELRSVIESYNLYPAPVVIDLMQRPDADVLEPLLSRVSSSSFPLLLVHGIPVDVSTVDRISQLTESGTLIKIVSEAGAIANGEAKKRRGRR